jgi:hypothetical protein
MEGRGMNGILGDLIRMCGGFLAIGILIGMGIGKLLWG